MANNGGTPYVEPAGNPWTLEAGDGSYSSFYTLKIKGTNDDYLWGKYWANIAGSWANYPVEHYFKMESATGGYTLNSQAWAGTDNAYLYINASNANRVAANSQEQNGMDAAYTVWQFVSEADYFTYINNEGVDMTSRIANSDCENNFASWTKDAKNGNNQMYGNSAFEYWGYNANNTSTFDYYQTITNLPKGQYVISANMYNDQVHSGEFEPTFGVYGTSGGTTISKAVDVAGTDFNWYSTEPISVLDGTLRIGVKNLADALVARWCVVDAFKLKLVHQYTDEELQAMQLNYSIKAVDAESHVIKEISSGTCAPGSIFYYPHAIEKDGTWYLTTANTYAATITENDQVVNVTYVADPDIVYYSEGEGGHAKQQTPGTPANYSMGNMVNNMASNAANAQDRGLNVCNLSAGTYMLTAKVVGTNKRAVNLRSGSTIITSLDTQTEGVKSSIFVLDEDKTNVIINGANNGATKSLQMQDIDYFYITRLDLAHLEKAVITNAKCDNNDGWPGGGRTVETMAAYDGQNRTVFSSNTYTNPATKAGQRSQAIKLPFAGAYKLTTYCKIAAETGYVAMWVDNTRNLTNKATANRMQADANGWVANEIYFTADAGETKTIYVNISKGSGNNNVDYAYVSGVELAYLGEADATASMTVNSEAQYGTFCAPFAVNVPTGVTASTAEINDNGVTIDLTEVVGNVIPANTPVILYAENGLPATTVYGKATAVMTPTNGCLTGVYGEMEAPIGSYVLQMNDGVVGFYHVEDVQPTIGANRAYIPAPAGAKVRAFYFDNNANAIEAISAIANNAIEAIYNANGVKVNALQKGINVVKMQNGKTQKVLVK